MDLDEILADDIPQQRLITSRWRRRIALAPVIAGGLGMGYFFIEGGLEFLSQETPIGLMSGGITGHGMLADFIAGGLCMMTGTLIGQLVHGASPEKEEENPYHRHHASTLQHLSTFWKSIGATKRLDGTKRERLKDFLLSISDTEAPWLRIRSKGYRLKKLQKMEAEGIQGPRIYNQIYGIHHRHGDDEQAMLYFSKTLCSLAASNDPSMDTLGHTFQMMGRKMNPWHRPDFYSTVEDHLIPSLIAHSYSTLINNIWASRHILTGTPEQALVTAMITQTVMERHEKVPPAWCDITERLWKVAVMRIEQGAEKRIIGDSQHEVFEYGPSPLVQGLLIAKKTPSANYEEERIRDLRRRTDNPTWKSPSVLYREGDKMIMRREAGVELPGGSQQAYHEAARYLAHIHRCLEGGIMRDMRAQAHEDAHAIGIDGITERWPRIFGRITGDIVFNKDAQGRNWVVHKDSITALDFDDKGAVHQEFDLAKLLYQTSRVDNPEDVVATYAKAQGRTDPNVLMGGVLAASIPLSIHYLRKTKELGVGNDDDRLHLLQSARNAAEQIGERGCIRYLDHCIAKI